MEDLTVKDTGNYTCTVCNVHGCINFTIRADIIGEYASVLKMISLLQCVGWGKSLKNC